MIDLTPLDVRKKRGDFRKLLRGYDPEEVDGFLDLVAERFEELVKENLTLRERSDRLQEQVASQEGRQKAVQDALVTAQQLRDEIRGQAQREAEDVRSRAAREAEELLARAERESRDLRSRTEEALRLARREAEVEARALVSGAERRVEERRNALEELERQRLRFLRSFRQLLERELDMVDVEADRTPLEEVAVDLDLGGGGAAERAGPAHEGRAAEDDEGVGRERASGEETLPGAALQGGAASGAERPALDAEDRRPDPDAPIHELARFTEERGDSSDPEPEEGVFLVDPEETGLEASGPGRDPRVWPESAAPDEDPRLWLSPTESETSDQEDEEERP